MKKKTSKAAEGSKIRPAATTLTEPDPEPTGAAAGKPFPVIGLGASAGGLEALKAFFGQVPENSGMAYVVVVHLTPKQPSMMPNLLANTTAIPVTTAEHNQEIEPNHVYVIPPNCDINIFNGRIQLLDLVDTSRHLHLPIDTFLKSLAQDQEGKAAAVILSGTGTDGSLGLREIKDGGGIVLAQDEKSAGYDGMPRSAIATGLVDVILPPHKMPQRLQQFFSFTTLGVKNTSDNLREPPPQQNWLTKIYAILRSRLGYDFSAYKINTIIRRIDRRMSLNHIEDHHQYARYLREYPEEVDALFNELLIGVTSFFRDPESFDILKSKILPQLFDKLEDNSIFKAWVPGCSTGEEVYSLAIILHEYCTSVAKRIKIQLFGTDLAGGAIDRARNGLFPANISADVSTERLKRFFVKEGDFYRINKEIRDSIIFSVQNVLRDPPFLRLNLLCCRNVLIYFNAEAQKKLLPLFHYTLIPDGILMLGSSESIGSFTNLFTPIDHKSKIFQRKNVPDSILPYVEFPSGVQLHNQMKIPVNRAMEPQADNIAQLTKEMLLDKFTPAAVLIDGDDNILHFQGRVSTYLEPPSGPPTLNIVDQARKGLRLQLSTALRMAKTSNKTIIRQGVVVLTSYGQQTINLHVCPQETPGKPTGRYLVVFEDINVERKTADEKPVGRRKDGAKIDELEKELQLTRENNQSTVEELESSNEELKSTNEELQSSNEELQSSNEELESSKEELQSLNEEVQTVNAELQSKVEELSIVYDDMNNLLNSTEIATIFVDKDLRLRRFTPGATAIINLIHTDIGRPLEHTVSNLVDIEMIDDVREVLGKLTTKVRTVQTTKGNWYSMRIIPYRTTDNRIDGAVLTFFCIDQQIEIQTKLENSIKENKAHHKLIRNVFDMDSAPMLVLDEKGIMVIANNAFAEIVGIPQSDIAGTNLLTTEIFMNPNPLTSLLHAAVKNGKNFSSQKLNCTLTLENRNYSITGRIIYKDKNMPYRILLRFAKLDND